MNLSSPFADGAAYESIQRQAFSAFILWAVRWYCKYVISNRELQEMLPKRGVNVDHSTIYRLV